GEVLGHGAVRKADGFAQMPPFWEIGCSGVALTVDRETGVVRIEKLVYEGDELANANVVDYRVPRFSDQPREIDLILAERRDGAGPFGAKGAGEGAGNAMGSAVSSAIARAIGVFPHELPASPERVWRLLRDRDPRARR